MKSSRPVRKACSSSSPRSSGTSVVSFLGPTACNATLSPGAARAFVQDNHSRSVPGTLRGLHYQLRQPRGKLVRCVRGRIFDVAVDISRGSPTFGHWVGIELSAAEASEVEYKGTDYYAPDDECGIIWKDP